MDPEPDVFLVALYTLVDDLYQEHFAAQRGHCPGAKPRLSDSEVLTLVVCAQFAGWGERRLLRHAQRYWRGYFPNLLSQSATNRRARHLGMVLVRLLPLLAEKLRRQAETHEVFDALPVPLMARCRGERHRLFGNEAGIGRGGSDRRWYYGCRLLITVTPAGVITGFVCGPANTEERWLAEALFCWRRDPLATPLTPADLPPPHPRKGDPHYYVGPTGPIWPAAGAGRANCVPYVADDGFKGQVWIAHWAQDYGARVLTPASYEGENAQVVKHEHACWRHVVETVNARLEGTFHLLQTGARSHWGLLMRVAAKLVAFDLGIWLNRLFSRPDLAFATLFDC